MTSPAARLGFLDGPSVEVAPCSPATTRTDSTQPTRVGFIDCVQTASPRTHAGFCRATRSGRTTMALTRRGT